MLFLALFLLSGCDQSGEQQQIEFQKSFQKTLDTQPAITQVQLQKGKIGLGLIPRNYNDSFESWIEALHVAQHLGVQVLQLPSGYWREDEPMQDAYQWDAMERFVKALDTVDAEFEVSQDFGGPFFHDQNMAPNYLQPIKLTDDGFDDAYLSYLTSYLEKFNPQVTRVLIHAEGTYAYFDKYPSHLNAYLKLLDRVVRVTKAKWPKIRIGVNIDPHNDPKILSAIAQRVDFVGFDVVQIDNVLEKPADLKGVIEFILANTSGKPVSLACGWSSAPGLGGGDIPQVEFYREVFKLLREHRARIEYVVVGQPFDENEKIVGPAYKAQFSHLPKPFVDKIIAWSTQLGLIRTDGSSKPAFESLRVLIQDYYQAQASQG